jgi:hypothetical protein
MRLGDFPGAAITRAGETLEWAGYVGPNLAIIVGRVADNAGGLHLWLGAFEEVVASVHVPANTVYVAQEREQ